MTTNFIPAENSKTSQHLQTVLVTGGSGYIGSWAIVALLQQGYHVRTTLRTIARQGKLRAAIATQTDPADRLTFFAANLMNDQGWSQATEGADYVLHVASSLGQGEDKGIDLIPSAREGTLRVLRASAKAGVQRVVVTSSVVAALPAAPTSPNSSPQKFDETMWTDPTAKGVHNYNQAKTLAERAAWNFIKEEGGAMTLATVLPAFVQGPTLSKDFASASVELLARLLSGKLPALPRIGFSLVDVRDVVDLHLKAMTLPAAAGQRFIASTEFLWLADLARIMREQLDSRYITKIPTRPMPDFLLKFLALFSEEVRFLAPSLGQRREFSATKATQLLGWQPRPIATTIVDCAESLIQQGVA